MHRIIKKKLFRIEFDLASALAIGSGENMSTDKDVILGSDKKPYIPASAIAGVCISTLDMAKNPENRKYKNHWGYIEKAGTNTKANEDLKAIESSVRFYDACILPTEENSKPVISIRDSVALDEYKTAKAGAKFDMEVVEPGIRFLTYVEQDYISNEDPNLAQAIAELFLRKSIRFGSKTARGYGAIDNVCVKEYEIKFDKSSDENREKIKAWAGGSEDLSGALESLQWVEYETGAPATLESESRTERLITITLKQVGGISIRRYTTEVAEEKNETAPDFTQLVSTDGNEKDADGHTKQVIKPVIPGTSWAGAFIHQIEKNINIKRTSNKGKGDFDPNTMDKLFGYALDGKKQKSKVYFGESFIEGAIGKQLSRNAIDRFSGGTKDGALFTEKTYYGGTTKLVIGIADDAEIPESIARAFAAAIVDLHYGFMAVGGETAIGRGLFNIIAMDGVESVPYKMDKDSVEKFYNAVYKVIKGEEGDQRE